MVSHAVVVTEARCWVGTPYQHQGQLMGAACDCLGLILGVGVSLGLLSFKAGGYSPNPDGKRLQADCEKQLIGRAGMPEAGLIGLFWYQNRRYPQHLAIFTRLPDRRLGLIHANQANNRVVEHGFDEFWQKRLVALYDYPGVS